MFNDRGARRRGLVRSPSIAKNDILLLVIYVDGINLAAHGVSCLAMGLIGVDGLAVKLSVLPPIPALCELFGDVKEHHHT